jgi:hypothetical protein
MRTVLFALSVLAAAQCFAQPPVVTLRATVTGNREQPKVMYLLPWQPPAVSEHEYDPLVSVAGGLFVPIDRDEFMREMEYRKLLAAALTGADSIE